MAEERIGRGGKNGRVFGGQLREGVEGKDAVDAALDRVKETVSQGAVDQVVIDAALDELGTGNETALPGGELVDENMSSTPPGEMRRMFTSPGEV